MALRILGALVAMLFAYFAVRRYRKGQLRRGELVAAFVVVGGLTIAALVPNVLDPLLSPLGFERGQERRLIGLLILSNLFTLSLVFRGISRQDQTSNELGDLVDYMALRRLQDEVGAPLDGACAVIMPAFDEAENLTTVLGEMPGQVCGMRIAPIVVADGCTDDTEATAFGMGAIVIRRDLRRGSGAAVRLGYQVAIRYGARIVVTMDSDGQHDPKEMERLVAPLLTDEADMVQGSRILGSFEVESRVRKHGVRFFSKLLTALSRTSITDPSNGYRAVTSEQLLKMDLRQDQFYVSEMILEAARFGLRVIEVPINLRRRASGSTKKPSTWRYAWGFTKAIARTWLRQPPGGRKFAREPRWVTTLGAGAIVLDEVSKTSSETSAGPKL